MWSTSERLVVELLTIGAIQVLLPSFGGPLYRCPNRALPPQLTVLGPPSCSTLSLPLPLFVTLSYCSILYPPSMPCHVNGVSRLTYFIWDVAVHLDGGPTSPPGQAVRRPILPMFGDTVYIDEQWTKCASIVQVPVTNSDPRCQVQLMHLRVSVAAVTSSWLIAVICLCVCSCSDIYSVKSMWTDSMLSVHQLNWQPDLDDTAAIQGS